MNLRTLSAGLKPSGLIRALSARFVNILPLGLSPRLKMSRAVSAKQIPESFRGCPSRSPCAKENKSLSEFCSLRLLVCSRSPNRCDRTDGQVQVTIRAAMVDALPGTTTSTDQLLTLAAGEQRKLGCSLFAPLPRYTWTLVGCQPL